MAERKVAERTFRAMNTDVRVMVIGLDPSRAARLDAIAVEFERYEDALSRFRPTSELSELNRSPGVWAVVSPLLFGALALAAELSAATSGLYEPGILAALEAAGYDRSFELLRGTSGQASEPTPAIPSPAFELRTHSQEARLQPGVRLDLGGIGKGLAVDAAAALLRDADGFLVDAGGDIRVRGRSPDGDRWGIGVQDPRDLEHDIAVLGVTNVAVATSSVAGRRWNTPAGPRHHLIDPRTGASATSDVLSATVIDDHCSRAEVFAKAVVIAGYAEGLALLAHHGLAGLTVTSDGVVHGNEALWPYLAEINS